MNLPTQPLTWTHGTLETAKRVLATRKRKKQGAKWRQASPEEYKWLKSQPQLEELGDFLFLAPDIKGELWLLIERVYAGFPDPPKYAFLAFDVYNNCIAAGDFSELPKAWSLPNDKVT